MALVVAVVVGETEKKKRERDVTHVPSDVESISHDHLPESEITTRLAVSRELRIGPGSRVEMGKYPETQSGEETGRKWIAEARGRGCKKDENEREREKRG